MSTRNRLNFTLQLSTAEILRLRDEYVADTSEMEKESKAFAAGKRISMGDFSRANLMAIVHWKSSRPIQLVEENRDDEINDALRLAIGAKSPRAAIAVLCGLSGVGVPMASAILTVIDPERFTVIDIRALETLGVFKPLPTIDDYLQYLDFCRGTARERRVALRHLDQALWQKSKDAARTLSPDR